MSDDIKAALAIVRQIASGRLHDGDNYIRPSDASTALAIVQLRLIEAVERLERIASPVHVLKIDPDVATSDDVDAAMTMARELVKTGRCVITHGAVDYELLRGVFEAPTVPIAAEPAPPVVDPYTGAPLPEGSAR